MENKALALVYLQLQGLSRFFPRVLFQSNLPTVPNFSQDGTHMVASSRNTVVATSAPSSLSGVAIHTFVASFLVLPYLLGGQPINNSAGASSPHQSSSDDSSSASFSHWMNFCSCKEAEGKLLGDSMPLSLVLDKQLGPQSP